MATPLNLPALAQDVVAGVNRSVKTVNGIATDQAGNVTVSGGGGGSVSVVDNGDGSVTVTGSALTDNSDGSVTVAA